jgi:hypothetical protein
MYPPKITDERIRSVIRELAATGKLPSGAALRTELATRYGSRGGVSRIYRLLAAETQGTLKPAPGQIASRLLEQEVRNLRESLNQARQREDAQQVYWRREIGQLRDRVQALEPLLRQAAAVGEVTDPLRREAQATEVRAGQLDVLLRAFGPATGGSDKSE